MALTDTAAEELHLVEELKRISQGGGERPHIAGGKLKALAQDHGVVLTPADAEHVAQCFEAALLVVPYTLARHGGFFLMLSRVFSLLSAEVTIIAPTQQVKHLAQALGHPVRHIREISDTTRLNGDYVLVLEADRLSLPEMHVLAHAVDTETSLWLAGEPRRVGGATPGQVLRDLYACAGVAPAAKTAVMTSPGARWCFVTVRRNTRVPRSTGACMSSTSAPEMLEAVAVLGGIAARLATPRRTCCLSA